ncbi:RNA polymerase factor sigma-54 [Sulfurimonas sp. MAG313]|nr:RNA polymerase factor sigma-54 [Sulfurimonas sp. MAG313]MDF1880094.1 RNA polymerase factor sigma-54 [Sulfurimonas sp. MAG313]
MALRTSQNVESKTKLSSTLRNWLPILHSSLGDLEEAMSPFVEGNPLIEVKSGYEENFEKRLPKKILYGQGAKNSQTEQIEALTIAKKSLYDILDEQMDGSLFPTPKSMKIAYNLIENLDEDGFFEGDIRVLCKKLEVSEEEYEKVRKRFAYLDPIGIAAKDVKECFIFQLDDANISDEAYVLAVKIINELEEIHSFTSQPHFEEALRVIQGFRNPPAIEYFEDSNEIICDLMIYFNDDGGIEVKINDAYYPAITIDQNYGVEHEYVTAKIKEAKSLVDALDMRRATLYKVGLMIVEYQYEFFTGGAIKPLTLKTLADEFGHNPSTISRAIANKYIACERGILAMKEFFTTAIDDDVSNAAIKEFLAALIKSESHTKPLSDMKILDTIQEKFKVKMVRRTIAKYRKQLNIAGSSERKKLYVLGL